MPFVFAVSRNNEYAKDYRRSPRRIGASPTCSPRARIDALPVLRRGSAARYRLRVLFCSLPVRRVRARQSDASAGSTGLECAYYIRCRARRTWPGLEVVKVRACLQRHAHGLNPLDRNRTRVPVARPYGRHHQTIPRSGCTAGPDIFHSGRSSNPPNRDHSVAFCALLIMPRAWPQSPRAV